MKKLLVVIVLAAVAVAIVAGVQANEQQEQEVLRIHIRANSDSEQDQRVKLEVRDAVVAYLTPVLAECQGLSEAKGAVAARQSEIERRAEHVLEAAGYRYGCTVKLTREEFPARTYDGLTLEEGIYDALIVELGDAEGANWWCVAFPPLCFLPAESEEYRSLIVEWIEKIKERRA